MEFFLGAMIMLVAFIVFRNVPSAKPDLSNTLTKYSQSHAFELIKPYIINDIIFEPLQKTQARLFEQKNTTRILFLHESAYWIKDNALFKADVMEGKILEETATEVDTMGMNTVQLEETMFIVEKLREGFIDDSWDSSDSQL